MNCKLLMPRRMICYKELMIISPGYDFSYDFNGVHSLHFLFLFLFWV